MAQQSVPKSSSSVKYSSYFHTLLSWLHRMPIYQKIIFVFCSALYPLSVLLLLITRYTWVFILLLLVATIGVTTIWAVSHFSLRGKVAPLTLLHSFSHGTNQVLSVSWSPTGRLLALTTAEGTIQFWDVDTGTLFQTIAKQGPPVWEISWSPTGQMFVATYLDGTLRLFKAETKELFHVLSGHNGLVWSVSWSPDEHLLASGSLDGTVRLWDIQTGETHTTLSQHTKSITTVAWSPDGHLLASGSLDGTVRLWDIQAGEAHTTLSQHTEPITTVAWSPDGHLLASGSLDGTIRLWDAQTKLESVIQESIAFACFIWSPHGHTIVCSYLDHTVRVLSADTAQVMHILEGHTDPAWRLAFSTDGSLLASLSFPSFPDTRVLKGMLRVWQTDSWECIAVLSGLAGNPHLAFHPEAPLFITPSSKWGEFAIRKLETHTGTHVATVDTVRYANAKVVLVGDSGVGKSGLALVLTRQPFTATDSTHGRRIWMFDEQNIYDHGQCEEIHEVLLWDLAGQPGYRLIHQLHLDEVAVALVVFDARSETDPFAGVYHWNRALSQARRVAGTTIPALKKFLVAARTDRGGIGVSAERLQILMKELAFTSYFETSAKEGYHIMDLKKAIKEAIDWETLPQISSTSLFRSIKTFLVSEKAAGRLLVTVDALYSLFLASKKSPSRTKDLWAEFETCIGRVESAGLIKRLSFGNLLLLQPEVLDAYASALVNAVKDEPDGLGSILEERVRTADFRLPSSERLTDKQQEKLLLIAMIEDLLQRELVLREEPFLVFPSQSTRENPYLPDPEKKIIMFSFEGPILNIYATLAVRLASSGMFRKKELWKNAVTYTASAGGMCSIVLHTSGEGSGELTLFFDQTANEQTRFHFEEYVQTHLQRKVLPESLRRRRIFVCHECGAVVTEQVVQLRLARNFDWLNCPVCSTAVSLLDGKQRLKEDHASLVQVMDHAADRRRDRETLKSILQGKRANGKFDVFLCHHSEDKPIVKQIGEQLKDRGILPWLDEWELQPGLPWQRTLEEQITQIDSAAVFVGQRGIGPWEQLELEAFLRQFARRKSPVIPVLLPEAPEKPQIPLLLEGMTWVDFRTETPDPLGQLLWGITGKKLEF
jgi:WD40 repeat protein/GTPase SAR1 family protein